jgi:hypothetical protein
MAPQHKSSPDAANFAAPSSKPAATATSETTGRQHMRTRLKTLVSELSLIEFENKRLLDDETIRLVAETRARNLLNDHEWAQIKRFLREALEYPSDPQKIVTRDFNPNNLICSLFESFFDHRPRNCLSDPRALARIARHSQECRTHRR